jgi:lantibiotic biosynthesis protein
LDDAPLAAALAARRNALAGAAAELAALERGGLLQRPRTALCQSYVHMHLNRLLGTERAEERLVLQLLWRTREGLARSPLR